MRRLCLRGATCTVQCDRLTKCEPLGTNSHAYERTSECQAEGERHGHHERNHSSSEMPRPLYLALCIAKRPQDRNCPYNAISSNATPTARQGPPRSQTDGLLCAKHCSMQHTAYR